MTVEKIPPKWTTYIDVDTIVETWDGVDLETERELIRLAPMTAGGAGVRLAAIWKRLSNDARANLHEVSAERLR